MQDKLETAFTDWVIALWPNSPILAVSISLTALSIVWGLAERTGLIISWLPKRKELTEALQTGSTGEDGKTRVDVGLEYEGRLKIIANGQCEAGKGINFSQKILGRLYCPTPLHPEALPKAINYAMVYTLLFWLLPWLAGGAGKLGKAGLLPENPAFFERILILAPALPLLIYFWLRHQLVLSGWTKPAVMRIAIGGAFTIAFTLAFADKGTFVFAFAVAFAVAFAFAFAIAFAIAFAFAMAVAVAVAFAGAGAAVGIGTGAIAGAAYYAIFWLIETLLNRYQSPERRNIAAGRLKYLSSLLIPNFLILSLVSAAPFWLPQLADVKKNWTMADEPSFPFLFFLGWLPFLNGVFDFLSVSLTQYFLKRMQEQRWTLLWWLVDVVTALLLVFGLYALVLGLVSALQWLGWGVDAKTVVRQFLHDPASSLWLLLLALTNILPTLLHWGLGLAGLWADFLGPNAQHVQTWAQKVLSGQPLGKVDAGDFADYLLFGQRGFSLVLALCLMSWAVWIFSWLLPQGLALFLSH